MKTASKVKTKKNTANKNEWQLQEAKAMFSEVVKKSAKKPQVITVHGEKKAVLMSYEEYYWLIAPKQSLFEFFQNSPFLDVELERPPKEFPREIYL